MIEVDGRKIRESDDLYKALDRRKVGDVVPVKVRRGRNEVVTLRVKLMASE